jgi:hypothetical protein
MHTVSNDNFGPLIAYLLPGATVLWGLSRFFPTLQAWFAMAPPNAPTIGGFLYLTMASLSVGMTVSGIRWLLVDTLHRWTGIGMPALDFGRLGQNVAAFTVLIEIHYRHYLFYANMLVATLVAYLAYRLSLNSLFALGWPEVTFVIVEGVFYITSRDTLSKYYARSQQLLSAMDQSKHCKID